MSTEDRYIKIGGCHFNCLLLSNCQMYGIKLKKNVLSFEREGL